MNKYEDVEIWEVKSFNDCLCIRWTSKSRGFGEYEFYFENNKWHIHSEYMSKEFGKYLLMKWFEECKYD